MKLVLLPAALAAVAAAQPLDQHSARGFDHFYNLEYEQAIRIFREGARQAPDDPDRHNHLAQALLYSMMLRSGSLESQLVTGNNPFLRRPKMNPTAEEEREFFAAVDKSMALAGARLAKDPDDRLALYAKGVALGLRGNYNFLVRKAWMDALRDATEGRKLHNRLTDMDPAWIDARLMQGVHDYVVGSLPWFWKLMGFLAGYRGDKDAGIRTVKLVAEKGGRNRIDAMILLGVAYRREKQPREAIPIVRELISLYPRNYLFLFELSQMYADAGEKEPALEALDRVEELRRKGLPGFKDLLPEKILFARGNLQFWYDDIEDAIANLGKASLKAAELDPNTAVYCWLRLGQSYDMLGKRAEAQAAYRRCVAAAPDSDAAGECRRYQSSPYRRQRRDRTG